MDCDTDWITTLTWPTKSETDGRHANLLMGCINGSVSMVTIKGKSLKKDELVNCSQPNGELLPLNVHYLTVALIPSKKPNE